MKNFESAKLELSYINPESEKETRITLNGLEENADTSKLFQLAGAISNLIDDPFTGAVAIERFHIQG